MNKVDVNENFTATADGQVELDAIVGNQQLGSTVVKVDGTQVAKGTSIHDLVLGTGADLNTKVVLVRTVINDVNEATNVTTMQYTLSDGTNTKTYDATGEVDKDFGVIVYFANFTITAS